MTQMQWEPVHNFLQLQDRINRVFSETYGQALSKHTCLELP